MKKILLSLCLCLFAMTPLHAEDVDLLSDEMLLGSGEAPKSDENSANKETQVKSEIADNEEKTTEDTGSIFGLIIKPISNWFKSEEKVTEVAEGEKESPLDKSIRMANEGSLEDQMNLGYMYLYGVNGVDVNLENAFKYYNMAAAQDDPIALNNLGSLYFSGIGVKQDREMAVRLFSKASELGNDNASLNLAFINLKGGAKNSARNKKAFDLFKKAQESGNKIAEFMLGYAYYKGFVVNPDYRQAFKLIRSAANGKSQIDEAQLVLGNMYVGGIGTVQNYNGAVNSYRAAVNQGNMEAILILADIYADGKITPQNMVLAHALYNVAAAQNVPDAAQKRDKLNESMQLEALTNAQAAAQNFKSAPSELTNYIRQTYGYNIRNYIDMNIPDKKEK